MGKYQDEAKQLLELVGGKENVVSVTHYNKNEICISG